MKLLILFAIFRAATAASYSVAMSEQWSAFKLEHQKQYADDAEEQFRMKIFMENVQYCTEHNKRYESGAVSYKMKINKFSDMTDVEFATLNGFNCTAAEEHSGELNMETFMEPANVQLPKQVDWREKGAVTPVKDQGHCGSCWSFSTTGALEAAHFRKTGQLISLSEQNLIDCATRYTNGCQGGWPAAALKYVIDNHGLDKEQSYPYEGQNDKCRYNPSNSGTTNRLIYMIPRGNEEVLKMAVATVGPISIAFNVQRSFYHYHEGVYYEPQCNPDQLTHAVLIVGYGTTDQGEDYWLVKNSWNERWGDQGYVKMARNKNNNCGIATFAVFPVV